MPLPPYIPRDAPDPDDRTDYQTVFARDPGAVAAPTAGLHFTDRLLAALDARGIAAATVAHDSARIGDARSIWDGGIITHVNATAARMGAKVGMTAQEFADCIAAKR